MVCLGVMAVAGTGMGVERLILAALSLLLIIVGLRYGIRFAGVLMLDRSNPLILSNDS